MNFASDNVTGAAPEILQAMLAANDGAQLGYGNDPLTQSVEARLKEVFETELSMFLVATGTAANSLALSVLTPVHGAVLCHWTSHVYEDECGAPEFFTSGARLIPVEGADGKFDLADLGAKARRGKGDVHMLQPSAVSLTQVTELGTVYSLDEIAGVADVCRAGGIRLHMDGARFTNALVALGCTPAEISWKAGVDVLSFGATKNGALGCEAILVFDKALAEVLAFRRKRSGHLFSKMRLLSAQMQAYLEGDLWLANARHANAMAARLHAGLAQIPGIEFPYAVAANMLFPKFPDGMAGKLKAAGFKFYDNRWAPGVCRLVTAFNTREDDVDAFIDTARRAA
ncbi:MAG: low specificity L-threonine aldolase [Rhodospirillaceae bacterium]